MGLNLSSVKKPAKIEIIQKRCCFGLKTHLIKLNYVWMSDFLQYFNLSRYSVNILAIFDPSLF